ncbi:MAG: MFS transporter [Pseudomonadota bacterium]
MLNRFRIPTSLWCALVLAFGYTTGMQLGKVSPYVDRLGAELGMGLTTAGWLTSLLALFVAIAAAATGRFVARIGVVPGLKIGAALMVLGAIAVVAAADPAYLLAARTIEAAGYVFAVVAAPAFLATAAPPSARTMLLALWGSVVPVGFALANLLAAGLPHATPLAYAFVAFTLPLTLFAIPLLTMAERPCASAQTTAEHESQGQIAWVPVFGFGSYVYLSMGFFAFLPTFLNGRPGALLPASAVALLVPLGNFATAALLARWRAVHPLAIAAAGFAGLAGASCFIFASGPSGAAAMAWYALSAGICSSCLFAAIPRMTSSASSATRTIGAIAQAGGIATLLGPPIAGTLIEHLGWSALAGSFVMVALVQLVAMLAAIRRSRRVAWCS